MTHEQIEALNGVHAGLCELAALLEAVRVKAMNERDGGSTAAGLFRLVRGLVSDLGEIIPDKPEAQA